MTRVKKKLFFSTMTVVVALLFGCSHKTLTVFFDGVPDGIDGHKVKEKKPEKKDEPVKQMLLADNSSNQGNSQHPPFATKKCRVCHDPDRRGFMIETQPGLCYHCHESIKGKFEHGPVASGNCTACHSPHSSDNPKLLVQVGQALCLNCHDAELLILTPAHDTIGHLPCTKCHNPHGGNKRYFLN